jgi:ubiquinone/menaquinone biosynthesis C-methylase UbiE
MDGENLDVADGSFDAVISRLGLIYFPDQQRAL